MPDATEPLRSEVRIAAPPEVVGVAALLDPRPARSGSRQTAATTVGASPETMYAALTTEDGLAGNGADSSRSPSRPVPSQGSASARTGTRRWNCRSTRSNPAASSSARPAAGSPAGSARGGQRSAAVCVSTVFRARRQIPREHPRLESDGRLARTMRFADPDELEAGRGELEAVIRAWCDWRAA
jgi:hypothetical protein